MHILFHPLQMIEVELSEVFKINLFLFLQSHLNYSAKAIILKM